MKSIQKQAPKFDQLTIVTTSLPDSVQGKPYQNEDGTPVKIEVTGGDGKNIFRKSKGLFPKGINLNEDGTITGSNEEEGVSELFYPEITVSSGDGQNISKEF